MLLARCLFSNQVGPKMIPIPHSDPVAYASTQVSQAKCSNCGRIEH